MIPFPPWLAAHMDAIAGAIFAVVWSGLLFWSGWSEGRANVARQHTDMLHAALRKAADIQDQPPRDARGRFVKRGTT